MKYSNAHQEATARYNKKTYDRVDVFAKKGQRQVIKEVAASQGKSINRFICGLIFAELERIEQEKQEKPE